ncbi:MAG: spondin domain-containing protein [Motiliproteus sp.]
MHSCRITALSLVALLGAYIPQANAALIQIEIENKSPIGGLFFTPVWLGFHNGSFDTFNAGSAASPALERLAEDGDASFLGASLTATQGDAIGAVVLAPAGFGGAPVFDPGETASAVFDLDSSTHRYLNYASMLIPSNDAFFGNDIPLELFGAGGNFVGDLTITILGLDIYDAGTEANTETDAAFLNQSGPNQGLSTAQVIARHSGFIPFPGGSILGGTNGAGFTFDPLLADFSRSAGLVELAEIRISQVPEPSSAALLLIAALGGLGHRMKKRRSKPNTSAG